MTRKKVSEMVLSDLRLPDDCAQRIVARIKNAHRLQPGHITPEIRRSYREDVKRISVRACVTLLREWSNAHLRERSAEPHSLSILRERLRELLIIA